METKLVKGKKIKGELFKTNIQHFHQGKLEKNKEIECFYKLSGLIFNPELNLEIKVEKYFDEYENAEKYLKEVIRNQPISEFIITKVTNEKICYYS